MSTDGRILPPLRRLRCDCSYSQAPPSLGRAITSYLMGFASSLRYFSSVGARVETAHTAARGHFLQVAFELLRQRVVRCDSDYRQLTGNQCEGTVLEFAGRVGLGVDVGHFLELERTFERDRIVQAPAEEQRVFLAREV